MAETVVAGFGNFPCPGCGQEASISTRIGRSIPCPCGLTHTTKGVVVETSGECSDPAWRAKQTDAGRAERVAK
jgi:hypothetical protein